MVMGPGYRAGRRLADSGAWLLSGLSGLLLTAGFPPINWALLSWVALVPLLLAIRGKTPGEAFGCGFVCGLVHYVSALYWIEYVVQHYGGLPVLPALSILLLLCSYLALYPACFAALARIGSDYPRCWIWGLPAAWVALEYLRAHVLTGFPWASLGYSQTPFIHLIQSADLWGVYGVGWLVVFANVCVAACGYRFSVVLPSLCFGLALLAVLGYGSWRLDQVRARERAEAPWPVAVVQGNVEQATKWDPDYQDATIERYRDLSRLALAGNPQPQLVVWPETAMPFFYGLDPVLTAKVQGIVRSLGVPVLFGSPSVILKEGEPRLLNKAFLVNPDGRIGGAYAKRHLVPFGEYVPLKKLLFFVQRLVPAAGDFIAGTSSRPLLLASERLGILICYEAIFPALARANVAAGASILINITNDAWFGASSAPYQHLEMSRWRAVENRVPVIRAANTGISAVIGATGELCGSLPLAGSDQLTCEVGRTKGGSFYTRFGDIFAWICCLTTLIGVLSYKARNRSNHA